MVGADLQSVFEGKLKQAGLLAYLDRDESQFLDLESSLFAELVARDSTKLAEFGQIAQELKSEHPSLRTVIRAHWDVVNVGNPVPAYNHETGTPRTAALYPVELRSGEGKKQVWVEVTTLASMVLKEHGFDSAGIKSIVADFVAEQLQKGGASYWDPIRYPQLEINADVAEYIVSKKSARK